jgi:hypothetical protein
MHGLMELSCHTGESLRKKLLATGYTYCPTQRAGSSSNSSVAFICLVKEFMRITDKPRELLYHWSTCVLYAALPDNSVRDSPHRYLCRRPLKNSRKRFGKWPFTGMFLAFLRYLLVGIRRC